MHLKYILGKVPEGATIGMNLAIKFSGTGFLSEPEGDGMIRIECGPASWIRRWQIKLYLKKKTEEFRKCQFANVGGE